MIFLNGLVKYGNVAVGVFLRDSSKDRKEDGSEFFYLQSCDVFRENGLR